MGVVEEGIWKDGAEEANNLVKARLDTYVYSTHLFRLGFPAGVSQAGGGSVGHEKTRNRRVIGRQCNSQAGEE